MKSKIFLLIVCSFLAGVIQAKNEYTVVATYRYYVPEHMSLEEAKRTALDRAKISAIEEKFGTVVSQANTIIIDNENGQSKSKFTSFGGSQTKGEWIETLSQPVYNIEMENGFTVISVSVKGKIREISKNNIDCKVKILRNGIEDKFESTEFKNANDLYISFQSPRNGYLSVYLLDTENAYCLLPYKRQLEGIFEVEANKEYILFNKKMPDKIQPQLIDEYVMRCDDIQETNMIYVLFSPNKFQKTVDNEVETYSPRILANEDFYKWVEKQNRKDENFTIIQTPITIKP